MILGRLKFFNRWHTSEPQTQMSGKPNDGQTCHWYIKGLIVEPPQALKQLQHHQSHQMYFRKHNGSEIRSWIWKSTTRCTCSPAVVELHDAFLMQVYIFVRPESHTYLNTYLTYEVEAGIDTFIHGDCVTVHLPWKSQEATLNKLPWCMLKEDTKGVMAPLHSQNWRLTKIFIHINIFYSQLW